MHQFLNITQETPINDYRNENEHLSVNLPPVQLNIMEQTFIKGLKPDIQAKISSKKLVGL